jgi:AcrR family transcriptional regulator
MTGPGDDTRARILDAAWREVEERGTADVTMAQIAAAAGVSRQLVYFHFAGRSGLLTEMASHRDEAGGMVEEARVSRTMEPVAGFEHLLRAWCAYVPHIEPVARALEAALLTGDDGAVAWRERFADLREAMRIALDRIARRDRLAAGWTVDAATDWALTRLQPSTRRHLIDERGWSPEDYTERTVRSLLRELVAPPG